jgi:hypothetical protein
MVSPGQAPTGLRVHVLMALTATCLFENPVPLCYLNAWQACCGPGLAFLASPPSEPVTERVHSSWVGSLTFDDDAVQRVIKFPTITESS